MVKDVVSSTVGDTVGEEEESNEHAEVLHLPCVVH